MYDPSNNLCAIDLGAAPFVNHNVWQKYIMIIGIY